MLQCRLDGTATNRSSTVILNIGHRRKLFRTLHFGSWNCSHHQVEERNVRTRLGQLITIPPSHLMTYLAFGMLYPSTCTFGWCFLLFLLQIFEYTICFNPTGHLLAYNQVCRSFNVTATTGFFFLRLALCRHVHSVFTVFGGQIFSLVSM
jgi:hypothetical protein